MGRKKSKHKTSNYMSNAIKPVAGTFVTGLGVAATAAKYAEPAIEKLIEQALIVIDKYNARITIPSLTVRDAPLNYQQASEALRRCYMNPMPVAMTIENANPMYHNFFNGQFVRTEPAEGNKVDPNSNVYVVYITQEVIDESKRLYQEQENEKNRMAVAKIQFLKNQERERKESEARAAAEKEKRKQEAAERRVEQSEKIKENISNATDTVVDIAKKIPAAFTKKKEAEQE